MAEVLKQVPWFVYAAMIVSIALGIAGFCVPPTGIIDGSVLTFTGEIVGGAAILTFIIDLPQYIAAGAKAKIEHGNTTITIGKKPDDEENTEEE